MSDKGDGFSFWMAFLLFAALMWADIDQERLLDRLEAAHTVER